MKKQNPIVTLLTDFGTEDGYVGAMKGVLLRAVPGITIVDITHEIEPYGIRSAAFALLNSYHYFPSGTVHVVVVDPGVGTSRSGLVVQTGDYFFVGPDNGVFSFVYEQETFQAFRISEKEFGEQVSPTFHGRDIFAPTAARLLNGEKIETFAEPVQSLESFYFPFRKEDDHRIVLNVLHIDHFGNLILNITREEFQKLGLPENVRIKFKNGFLYGIQRTFADAGEGQILALWDSSGFLQIAQNRGNAARLLKMSVGDPVFLELP